MKRRLKKMLIIVLLMFGVVALGVGFYLQQPKFGVMPSGERLEAIKDSPHYVNEQFENLLPTPVLVGDQGFVSALWNNLFNKRERLVPNGAIPSVKTDLLHLDKSKDIVVWLGHSSYFIQIEGKRILVDPVFSASAAPVSFANKAFQGANPYTAEDMPEIDYLLISHDHWDHLDYPTVFALKPKIKNLICGLGVGAYFAHWGFTEEQIQEADWQTALQLEDGLAVHVLPARHYSGRMLTKNKTLWVGFALTTSKQKIFISGDSGYGPHFKEIGDRFDGFDLVMLDHGQYDQRWPYIHMTPEEAVQAAGDLQAKALIPTHVGKFSIANHAWDDPFQRVAAASKDKGHRLLTPIIGEPVELGNEQQNFSYWWETLQ